MPDLAFYFGEDVSQFEQTLIETAIEVARDLLEADADVKPPVSVFANGNPIELAAEYADHARAQRWRAELMAQRLQGGVAEASYRGVAVNTNSQVWEALSDTTLMRAIAHEYVHVVQLENMGLGISNATLVAPPDAIPPAGPFWLLEGSAEVVSYYVLERLDLANYTETVIDLGIGVRGEASPLSDMESYLGYTTSGQDGLAWSVLAADYLLRNRSLSDLFDFWEDIRSGSTWEDAFVRRFGMRIQTFYKAFETYYHVTFGG